MLKEYVIQNLQAIDAIGDEELCVFQKIHDDMCKTLNKDPQCKKGSWLLRRLFQMITDWYFFDEFTTAFTNINYCHSSDEKNKTPRKNKLRDKILLLEVVYSILDDSEQCNLQYVLYSNEALCKTLEKCIAKHKLLSERIGALCESISQRLYTVPGSEFVKGQEDNTY